MALSPSIALHYRVYILYNDICRNVAINYIKPHIIKILNLRPNYNGLNKIL
jgi:hypothetical protein